MRLYSRDDVWGSLEAQRIIIEHAANGWRPVTPQSRGGQAPLIEPDTRLPGPAENWDAPVVPALAFRTIQAKSIVDMSFIETDPGSDLVLSVAGSSSGSLDKLSLGPWAAATQAATRTEAAPSTLIDEKPDPMDNGPDVDSSDVEPPGNENAQLEDWCYRTNKFSGTCHLAQVLSQAGPKTLEMFYGPSGTHVRPLCGSQVNSEPDAYTATAWIPTGFEPCKRLGCRTAQLGPRCAGGPGNSDGSPPSKSASSGDGRGVLRTGLPE